MTKSTELQPGSKYGRLTVIKYAGIYKKPCGSSQSSYECLCDCGNRVTVLMQALKSGNTKSCGCLANEVKHNKRLPDHKGVINHIILQYKRHAKDRNFCWELDYDTVKNLIMLPCFYCGAEKSNHKVTKNCKEGFDHNGIDRIDSSKGYTPDNVVSCCKICNKAKMDMDQKDFILWIQRAANHTKAMANQWGVS